jgi:hypothetical protein
VEATLRLDSGLRKEGKTSAFHASSGFSIGLFVFNAMLTKEGTDSWGIVIASCCSPAFVASLS